MDIYLEKAGKRFNRDWIFRHLDYHFEQGKKYAITGPNGSGKSTLLQVIAGSANLTEGNAAYHVDGNAIENDHVYKYSAIVAPYLDLVEEMSATEFLRFHAVFKRLVIPVEEILEILGLGNAASKQLRNFSSGMKQRIKLAQAVFSDVPVLFLDEPGTNLDKA
ncbi:MAG: ATP-binding cassette protein, partial [Chitinophagaceae bacterium]|nr:ATP-binding cassette protein [Chitinophagaceae bacterium]